MKKIAGLNGMAQSQGTGTAMTLRSKGKEAWMVVSFSSLPKQTVSIWALSTKVVFTKTFLSGLLALEVFCPAQSPRVVVCTGQQDR